MNAAALVFTIILGVLILATLVLLYLMKRNHKVCKYRISLVERFGANEFDSFVSYERMLLSILPLKDKYWVK